MATYALTADIRTKDERAADIRKRKKVPGIVYGKTQAPISFCVDSSDLLRLYRKAGESNIINLKVGKEDIEVLVHQTQRHPITGDFTHIDFYAITRGEALQTNIHINFIGESEAKKEGAIIEESMKEITVKCLPRNLVDHFDVDLWLLKEAGDFIRVSDLGIDPEKYEVLVWEDDVVASAIMPKIEVIEDTAPEMELPEWVAEEWATEEWAEGNEQKSE